MADYAAFSGVSVALFFLLIALPGFREKSFMQLPVADILFLFFTLFWVSRVILVQNNIDAMSEHYFTKGEEDG